MTADVAARHPETRRRLRRDALRGAIAFASALVVFILVRGRGAGGGGDLLGFGAILVAITSLVWLARTLRIAAILRGSPWERVRVDAPVFPVEKDSVQLLTVANGRFAGREYARSLLVLRPRLRVPKGGEVLVAGLPGDVVAVAVSERDRVLLFHTPDVGTERAVIARRGRSRYVPVGYADSQTYEARVATWESEMSFVDEGSAADAARLWVRDQPSTAIAEVVRYGKGRRANVVLVVSHDGEEHVTG